jgi:hypothetical protein
MARLTKSKEIIRFLQKEAVKSYGPEGSQGRKMKTVRQMDKDFFNCLNGKSNDCTFYSW